MENILSSSLTIIIDCLILKSGNMNKEEHGLVCIQIVTQIYFYLFQSQI